MKVTEETTLFTQALSTMNKAIAANQSKPVYKQMLEASEKLADGLTVGVAVYKDDPSTPHDYYTVRFENARLELLDHGKRDDMDLTWKVSQEYIENLANDPDRYINNPALMDWDWLRSRLGL